MHLTSSMTNPLRVLGVCGSLRAKSYNRALLHAAIELVPPDMVIEEYIGIGDLPHYNADIDVEGGPPSAVSWRGAVRAADALLFAMPEYNFGPSGVLKNAVDWASRPPTTSVLHGKPVALMGASTGMSGTARAQLALRQSFVFTQSLVLPAPEVLVSNAATRFDEALRLTDVASRDYVHRLLVRLGAFVRQLRAAPA
ncbi:MAG TPA: NADPH-dependent FMN reductase [Gemmatimonadaceae bacterium]